MKTGVSRQSRESRRPPRSAGFEACPKVNRKNVENGHWCCGGVRADRTQIGAWCEEEHVRVCGARGGRHGMHEAQDVLFALADSKGLLIETPPRT